MHRARTELRQGIAVRRGRVALVHVETVLGVTLVQGDHLAIPAHLASTLAAAMVAETMSPFHTASCGRPSPPGTKPSHRRSHASAAAARPA